MNKTRCAICCSSLVDMSGIVLGGFLTKWALLAELVEKKVLPTDDEVLVWSLDPCGGEDEPCALYAVVELCQLGLASLAPTLLTRARQDVEMRSVGSLHMKAQVPRIGVEPDCYRDYRKGEEVKLSIEQAAAGIAKELRE